MKRKKKKEKVKTTVTYEFENCGECCHCGGEPLEELYCEEAEQSIERECLWKGIPNWCPLERV